MWIQLAVFLSLLLTLIPIKQLLTVKNNKFFLLGFSFLIFWFAGVVGFGGYFLYKNKASEIDFILLASQILLYILLFSIYVYKASAKKNLN